MTNLLTQIEKAFQSTKMDARMRQGYQSLPDKSLDYLSQNYLDITARMTQRDTQLDHEGLVSQVGPICTLRVTYAQIPELVENDDIRSLRGASPLHSDGDGYDTFLGDVEE